MSLQIFNCEQGTPDWYACRLGIPTASEFDTVMRKSGRGPGGTSKERRTYMLKLIGERLTGEPMESYSNVHMERGKLMEDEARNAYSLIKDVEPERVGFIRNGEKGASPDSLIDSNGTLEIKTKLPHLQLDVLLDGILPAEHKAQVQGQLWVSEREFCDFVSYWPRLEIFVVRVYRDEAFIKQLADAIDQFNQELAALQARFTTIRRAA